MPSAKMSLRRSIGLPLALLGRHVAVLAFDRTRDRLGRALLGLPSRSRQLSRCRRIDHDVRRRDVAMHDVERLALLALALVA